MNAPGRLLLPLIITFAIFSTLFLLLASTLRLYHIDPNVLLAGNCLFFLISILSFFIQRKGLYNKNPHVFVRSVMSGMMLKMVVCVLAVFIYVYTSGNTYNKRGIFLALFLYLVYLAVEVAVIMKMNKNKKSDA